MFIERSDFFRTIFAGISSASDPHTTIALPDVHPDVYNSYLGVVLTRQVQTPHIPEEAHLGPDHALKQLCQLAQYLGDREAFNKVQYELRRVVRGFMANQNLPTMSHVGPQTSANTAGASSPRVERDQTAPKRRQSAAGTEVASATLKNAANNGASAGEGVAKEKKWKTCA